MARAATPSFRPPRQNPTGNMAGRPLPGPNKGRGACSNASGRYELEQRGAFDDGWTSGEDLEPLKTSVTIEHPKKILSFNKSPDVGFDRSINPYRGCEHGCIYCFARPTHAYMGLSAGLDFEQSLYAKPSAPKLVENEFSSPKYRPQTVAFGTNTDPYQPIERDFLIMRKLLKVFSRFNHPFSILTKSILVARDIDLIAPMAKKDMARAMVSITTQDRMLARSMEPRASTPEKRFEAIKKLSDAGVPTGVATGPMIPGLNDHEMESIMEKAAALGATYSTFTIIRLPLEVAPLFQEWLEQYAPDRANRVMRHIREINGGRNYDPHWSRGREISSPYAGLIRKRHAAMSKRLGFLSHKKPLDLGKFRVPHNQSAQLSLFSESEAK